jgi:glycerol kinase
VPRLLALFRIPAAVLPEVCDSASDFGHTDLFGAPLTIGGMAGDQQAALVGQSCFAPGQAKITYGTGGFMLLNTGDRAARSRARLLTTIAYRVDGQARYAMEGSIFVAGAAIKWLRDKLGIIVEARQTQEMAARLPDNGGVFMVPAFVGLGAPHWHTEARGMLTGMTFDTGAAHIARAALESVAFQTADLVAAMEEGAGKLAVLRVDGGMAANDWFCQFLAIFSISWWSGRPTSKPPRWARRCWRGTSPAPGPMRCRPIRGRMVLSVSRRGWRPRNGPA